MPFSAAYQSLSPFRRYNRLVHYSGYGAGVLIWVLAYRFVGSLLPWFGWPAMAVANTAAAVVCGLFVGVLFTAAIGSPAGNVLLPVAVPLFVPDPLFSAPFPETSWVPSMDLTFVGITLVGIYAGPIAATAVIGRWYRRNPRPRRWDADVMPYSVRFSVDDGPDDSPPLDPRVERYPEIEFDRIGAAVGLVVVMPAAAVALHLVLPYVDDELVTLDPLLFLIFFVVAQSLRVQTDEA